MIRYDVSVVIAVYNNEKYLDECINSVLKQKHEKERIQIILVNDGSTDKSKEICEEYATKYSNIFVINQENKGVSEARNEGIKIAEGKYIMILDSDDFLSENAIEELYQFMEKNKEIDIASYTMQLCKDKEKEEHYRNELYDKRNRDL